MITKDLYTRYVCLFIALSATLFSTATKAQTEARVLFIGNSYTEVNNLPQMTSDIARSMNCSLIWSSNTPGGCTFSQHCGNRSMDLICSGGWDFVVLQEQSQYPSFPQSQVEAEVFPYAQRLVDSVYANNPCSEPMFYMTWGRKDGDAQNAQFFPVLGTYEGMDSMLYERYVYMAESNDASVCPVGRVWRYLRQNYRDIELYAADGSHPSIAGTYAAACSFFVMLFHKNPAEITYFPNGIEPDVANIIIRAVSEVVYDQLHRWQRPTPHSSVEVHHIDGFEASFAAYATMADSVVWDFGDGNTLVAPADTAGSITVHQYADTGLYPVSLIARRHCMADTAMISVLISVDSIVGIPGITVVDEGLVILPNPTKATPTVTINGKSVSPSEIVVISSDGRKLTFNNDIPTGVYTLMFIDKGRIYSGRLIKQ